MKIMKKIIFMIAAAFAAVSCAGWLEVEPISNIPTDGFYMTPTEAEQALLGVYNGLLPIPYYMWNMSELRSDDVWNEAAEDANAARDYFEIFTYSPTLSIVSTVNDAWSAYYEIINRANLLLAKLETETVFDDELEVSLKGSFSAEARLLRAYAYFDLVRYFGRVPMVTEPQTVDEAMATGQSEAIDIYEKVIIPDLQYAIDSLDYTAYDCKGDAAPAGRVNKIVAQALLGRVYTTMTGYPLYDASKKEPAMELLKAVVDYADAEGKFWAETGLEWRKIWLSDNDNKYHIWEIQYAAKEDYGNPMIYWMVPVNNSAFFPLKMSGYHLPGTDELLALYETDVDADGISDDVRKEATFNFDPAEPTHFYNKFFEHRKKLKELGYPDNSAQVVNRTYFPINHPLIRLEDVMLMYAELAGDTPTAIGYVNRIRTRAGIGELSAKELADFQTAVRTERRRELAGEGIRWHDIVRWNQHVELVSAKFRTYGSNASGDVVIPKIYDYARRVTQGTYLYPIPDVQMKVKEGLYTQNEAYR